MCCNFDDEGVFCDRCLSAVESRRKMEAETRRREKPKSEIVFEDPDSEKSKKNANRGKDKLV
ncbi:MAG: hypothetical protein RL120_07500, partial [Gammaproteobacteria bacterium]